MTNPRQTSGRAQFALVFVLSLTAFGCAIRRPPGWPTPEPTPIVVHATPGHMYGFVPLSWDLPDGEKIQVEVHRASVMSGLGFYQADIAFTASLAGDSVRCESEPAGPGVPETRFGCWSSSGEDKNLAFWLAPGENCPARHLPHVTTLTKSTCWNGVLTMDGEHVALHHGYFESTEVPVGYVTWTSQTNELLLAANIVSDMQVRLYESEQELPALAKRRLILMTVALSWWKHASTST